VYNDNHSHFFRVSYPTQVQSQREVQTLLGIPDTCPQVLAIVLQNLFPETKVTIRPTTETGFYIEYPINHPWGGRDEWAAP